MQHFFGKSVLENTCIQKYFKYFRKSAIVTGLNLGLKSILKNLLYWQKKKKCLEGFYDGSFNSGWER